MIDRIFLYDNENTYYPLAVGNTKYPDGLISSIHVLVPDLFDRVMLNSVNITNSNVSVVMSCHSTTDANQHINLYSTWNKDGIAVSSIYREDTNEPVGWISFGAIAGGPPNRFMQDVDLCASCIHRDYSIHNICTINGVKHSTPEVLNITVSGDLDCVHNGDKWYITNTIDPLPDMYDKDTPSEKGSILTVNGEYSESGILCIKLPTIEKNGTRVPAFDVFYDDSSGYSNDIVVIDIKNNVNLVGNNPFTCPDSDILVDRIISVKENDSSVETPLDAFIEQYRAETIKSDTPSA